MLLVAMYENCRPPLQQSIFCIVNFLPFLAKSYFLYLRHLGNYSKDRKWKKALECLNRDLIFQQYFLGEYNEIKERTLQLIATCLMNVVEDFLALVSLEEAMCILMNNCEEGLNEAARIATHV